MTFVPCSIRVCIFIIPDQYESLLLWLGTPVLEEYWKTTLRAFLDRHSHSVNAHTRRLQSGKSTPKVRSPRFTCTRLAEPPVAVSIHLIETSQAPGTFLRHRFREWPLRWIVLKGVSGSWRKALDVYGSTRYSLRFLREYHLDI